VSRVLSILKWIGAIALAALGVVVGVLTLQGWRDAEPGDDAKALARNNREKAERDLDEDRKAAAAEARARSKDREELAVAEALAAGAGDDGDPNRVLERHSEGPPVDRD